MPGTTMPGMARTHGLAATYRDGCRCDKCRNAANLKRKIQRRARREQVKREGFPGEIPHGRTGYANWGCRCATCRAASSELYQRRRNAPRDQVPHGASGYINWACKCDVCRAANPRRKGKAVNGPGRPSDPLEAANQASAHDGPKEGPGSREDASTSSRELVSR